MKYQIKYIFLIIFTIFHSFKTQSPLIKRIESLSQQIDFKYIYINNLKDIVCFQLQEYKLEKESQIICTHDNKPFQFPSPQSKFNHVSIGFEHQCAIIDLQLYCWLLDQNFKIPHQSILENTQQDIRTQIPIPLSKEIPFQISSGQQHNCGTSHIPLNIIECWGRNDHSQLDIPEDIDINYKLNDLYAGFWCSCVSNKGRLFCWGHAQQNVLEEIPSFYKKESKYRRFNISISLNNICVSSQQTKGQQNLYTTCWGLCSYGICDIIYPIQTNSFGVSIGWKHACVIDISHLDQNSTRHLWSGGVVCWGSNKYGELIIPTEFQSQTQQVEAGNGFSCAMRMNFFMNCWGSDAYVSKEVRDFTRSISVGANHTCANKNGKGWCWGNDMYGQSSLEEVSGFKVGEIVNIEAGYDFTCISDLKQEVECFGLNFRGQTDVPSIRNSNIENSELIIQLSLSLSHSCVIYDLKSRNLACWGGNNDQGELNIPESYQQDMKEVSTGDDHTCAVKVLYDYDGPPDKYQINNQSWTLICWGSNEYGQVEVDPSLSHSQIMILSAGGAHTCVLEVSKFICCWGSDSQGQTKVNQQTNFFDFVEQVSAGVVHTCVLSQGVKCQGIIDHQKGSRFEFEIRMVKAGWEHDCLIDETGRVDCRGSNEYGQCDFDRDEDLDEDWDQIDVSQ